MLMKLGEEEVEKRRETRLGVGEWYFPQWMGKSRNVRTRRFSMELRAERMAGRMVGYELMDD